jgi:hypothetical protein
VVVVTLVVRKVVVVEVVVAVERVVDTLVL